jgi:DUF177 domain-containing protein
MRYKIKDIPSDGRLVQEELTTELLADALVGYEPDLTKSTANVRLELSKDRDDNVYARGDLKGLLTLGCVSCLGPAVVAIDAPLNMTFVAEGDEADESDDPLDDVDVATHDGETLDLDTIVREQMILALPISPRCREGCLGLCATCGHNRNESNCGHGSDMLKDPRFSALKNLKLS